MSIEAGPSLLPKKKYCDITGYEAPYTHPRTHLRFCSSLVFHFIQSLSDDDVQKYLALRDAQSGLR